MKKIPQRVGAAIIKDNKMLVVSEEGKDLYWTPGGKVEFAEKVEDALRRELKEELGVEVKAIELIDSGIKNDSQSGVKKEFFYYLVEIIGEIVPSSEINLIKWVSKSDLVNNKINISEGAINCMKIFVARNLL